MKEDLKIESIKEESTFTIITNEDEYFEYTRYSEDCWYQRMEESIEPLYNCKELEDKFQEYYLNNIEKHTPNNIKYSDYIKNISLYKDMCDKLLEELRYERDLKEYLIKSFKQEIKNLKEDK